MKETNLSSFNNDWYKPGSKFKIAIWYCFSSVFINSYFLPISSLKVIILKIFGAKIGTNVVIKPNVNIKYPWKLSIGDNSWIGEGVWIDNLDQVDIRSNCCLSQGVRLICGNHDYSKTSFDLFIKPIIIEDGVWIGANSSVSGGVCIGSHAVLSIGSVCTNNLDGYAIYAGNPIVNIKERVIN